MLYLCRIDSSLTGFTLTYATFKNCGYKLYTHHIKFQEVCIFRMCKNNEKAFTRSKAVRLMWFLTVNCSCCPYLYFAWGAT